MSPVNGSGLGPVGSRSVGSVCLVYSEKVQDPDPIGVVSRFRIPNDVRGLPRHFLPPETALTAGGDRGPREWVTRALVAGIITRSIDGLGVAFPEVSDSDRRRLVAARRELMVRK